MKRISRDEKIKVELIARREKSIEDLYRCSLILFQICSRIGCLDLA